jgi:hypothetical protein
MNRITALIGTIFSISTLPAQEAITITSADMFNEIGLYYRAFMNNPVSPVPVSDLIGEKGGPQLWDFADGPTDTIQRFDYVPVDELSHGQDFPDATFAERKTNEATGESEFLYLEKVPEGRKVYGFYSENFNPLAPSNVFVPPIVDFPAQINFGDKWSTAVAYTADIFGIPAIISQNSTFEVDAFGIIDLPEVGFGDTLRVNELVEISIEVDLFGEGTFQNISTDFVRNLYWFRPGMGIAAQMNSTQSGSPPADNFNNATAFLRLFETNKEAGPSCEEAQPVSDLSISLGSNSALLKWTKTECAQSYRVESTTTPDGLESWTELGTTSDNFMLDTSIKGNPLRFYRVIAL